MGSLQRQSRPDSGMYQKLLPPKNEYSELGVGRSSDGGSRFGSRAVNKPAGDKVRRMWTKVKETLGEAYQMGKSDPRKVIFALKAGLALAVVSLLIFLKEPSFMADYSIWAIMTVVVVFEFSIGATFNKGLNRAFGTLSAGALAVGLGLISSYTGVLEEPLIIIYIFIAGSLASFVKLHPTMKDYEYGFRVFLLTYCIVLVNGTTGADFMATAFTRLVLIGIGAAICVVVNTFVYPIWAGEDLHKLVVKNFRGVATSLEGCVNGYLECAAYERVPSKILITQAMDDPMYSGCQSAIQSASQEESLKSFAYWEPPHGRYNSCNYPWDLFVRMSGALRHCAFMVMALHGCILSEIQAPPELRQVFSNEIKRVGVEGAKVLRLLGEKVEKMEKLNNDTILDEIHEAAEELQMLIDRKSYLLVHPETWPKEVAASKPQPSDSDQEISHQQLLNNIKTIDTPSDLAALDIAAEQYLYNSNIEEEDHDQLQLKSQFSNSGVNVGVGVGSCGGMTRMSTWPCRVSMSGDNTLLNAREVRTYESASCLSVATFTSQLVEFVARLGNLIDSFKLLEEKARFKDPPPSCEGRDHGYFWTRLASSSCCNCCV